MHEFHIFFFLWCQVTFIVVTFSSSLTLDVLGRKTIYPHVRVNLCGKQHKPASQPALLAFFEEWKVFFRPVSMPELREFGSHDISQRAINQADDDAFHFVLFVVKLRGNSFPRGEKKLFCGKVRCEKMFFSISGLGDEEKFAVDWEKNAKGSFWLLRVVVDMKTRIFDNFSRFWV